MHRRKQPSAKTGTDDTLQEFWERKDPFPLQLSNRGLIDVLPFPSGPKAFGDEKSGGKDKAIPGGQAG